MNGPHKIFDYLDGAILFNNGGLPLICLVLIALVAATAWLRRGKVKPEDGVTGWEVLRRSAILILALPPMAIASFYGGAVLARVGHVDEVTTGCVLGVNTTLSHRWDGFHHGYNVLAGGGSYRFGDSLWGDGLGRRKPFPVKPQSTIRVHTLFDYVVRIDQLSPSCDSGAPDLV